MKVAVIGKETKDRLGTDLDHPTVIPLWKKGGKVKSANENYSLLVSIPSFPRFFFPFFLFFLTVRKDYA
jgi:hypothetical protein